MTDAVLDRFEKKRTQIFEKWINGEISDEEYENANRFIQEKINIRRDELRNARDNEESYREVPNEPTREDIEAMTKSLFGDEPPKKVKDRAMLDYEVANKVRNKSRLRKLLVVLASVFLTLQFRSINMMGFVATVLLFLDAYMFSKASSGNYKPGGLGKLIKWISSEKYEEDLIAENNERKSR